MTTQSVFVAVYSYKYGEDIRVFATHDAALAWRDSIGEAYFQREFPHDEKPANDVGESYFNLQAECGDEWFSITEAQIEEAEAA